MRLTLPHQTTQENAILVIDQTLDSLMKQKFSGIEIIDPEKKWDGNIMRYYFLVEKLFLSLEFSGTIIVTDQEVVGEGNIPNIVTTFFPEDKIKEVIKKKFNEIFNIK